MANQEHLERLEQGVSVWNQWREYNPKVEPDLNGANLSRFDLNGANLSRVRLCRANLSEASLSRANLCEVKLWNSNLYETNLSEANLWRAELHKANLDKTNLSSANLRDANLQDADLRGVNLSGVDLRDINLNRLDLRGVNLSGVDLRDVDLSGVILRETSLSGANLSGVDLSEFDLRDVDLRKANLNGVILRDANLRGANLSGVNLCSFDLSGVDLRGVNLSGVDLRGFDLCRRDLREVNLSSANLSGSDLNSANLSDANLSSANLSDANLSAAQILGTGFEQAVFTGACLKDCNSNSATRFDDAICEYIYLQPKQQERRPREGNFKPGEFSALFQRAVDTVDLIFKDGIDWRAFFQSFQKLHSQYSDHDLFIQAIEKKRHDAFVVRLAVPPEVDKTVIESRAKELYIFEIKALETQYEERLRLQGQHLEDARQTIEVERREKATLMGVMTTMANSQQGPKYDLSNAQFAGGFAETVQGNQYGGVINNYGSNTADITRLLTALRDQAQAFPTDQKDEANDTLDDLERDLAEEQPDSGRIGRRLKRLVAIATTLTIGATAFTADLAQLADVLNVPLPQIEQVQPEQLPPSGTP
ncbi:pentapeptide repeat-containing protein [Leptothoe sp. PORK10 BA2]|uniref:pentapeptide repeat-containing protein n=1 Tax=Leptothoe sp. PORK10 BA2 TaxID=3110254 RepID=UPI002B209E5A|nr:pentapeptide repeat-containing protein [Leptothoe sp. PORK10 BA2]MEA5464758.1 pentapeptide repeat-containing protein [Leptothoe sp. PORK10 BA2]